MSSSAKHPEPTPDALDAEERRRRERQEAIDAYNARRAELGLPPMVPEKIARFMALDAETSANAAAPRRSEEQKRAERETAEQHTRFRYDEIITARADSLRKTAQAREQQKAATPAPRPASDSQLVKEDKIINFPLFPSTVRAVVNEIASSALFAAIKGKDRKFVKNMPVAATGETQMFFTGELLNQDDHDAFMQLVGVASARPAGEYVTVSAHSLLKALGRSTGGDQHKQLDDEIKRLKHAGVEIKTARYTYIGSLIHDAVKDEHTKHWVFRLNENLVPLYSASCYTLIDWEQRKRLKGKDLARWLQLEIARHVVPFPVKVETLRERCGSTTKELWKFRQMLKAALEVLKAEDHIATWRIDEKDLVHIDRGAALTASQRRSLEEPKPRKSRSKQP